MGRGFFGDNGKRVLSAGFDSRQSPCPSSREFFHDIPGEGLSCQLMLPFRLGLVTLTRKRPRLAPRPFVLFKVCPHSSMAELRDFNPEDVLVQIRVGALDAKEG